MNATEQITLRPLRVEDAEAMAHVLADPRLYEFTGGQPPTVEQLHRQYTVQTVGRSPDSSERWINHLVLLAPDHHPIGYVQATVPRDGHTAEIAWVIGQPWQGHGYATTAARLLAHQLADQGVRELSAHIHPDHTASQRIAAHLGLHPTDIVEDGEIRWRGPALSPA